MARRLQRSWLDAYLQYVNDIGTEAPLNYHYWSGISALSAALKKKVWIDSGRYNLYPNQYIILVGPPGIGKGEAINPIVELVKEAGVANYLADRITAEKVLEELSNGFSQVVQTASGGNKVAVGDSAATIVSTELPVFLQASEWMLPLMCEMWDRNEYAYSTKTKNSYTAKGLCVGLLGGCVPDFIRKLNRDATAAVTGGFTSRCIFIFAGEKSQLIPFARSQKLFKKQRDELVNDLQHIATLQGEFDFDPIAHKMWESQYAGLAQADTFATEVMLGFVARMRAHIFKVAMALSVADNDKLTVSRDNLFNSITLINKVRDTLDITFRGVGESPIAASQDRILRYVETKGQATFKELLRSNYRHVTDDQLRSICYVLIAAGFVTEVNIGGEKAYISTNKKRGGTP